MVFVLKVQVPIQCNRKCKLILQTVWNQEPLSVLCCRKTCGFLVPILLPYLFRQEFSSIYLHNVYHKAPDISLHSLPISRIISWRHHLALNFTAPWWHGNDKTWFFLILSFALTFALPRFTRLKCKRMRKCRRNKMKQFQLSCPVDYIKHINHAQERMTMH